MIVRMSPLNDANMIHRSIGGGGVYQHSLTTLSVFWPEVEHGKLIARWPHLAVDVGATWDGHRRQIERHCALVEQLGHKVKQTAGDVDGLEIFLKDNGVKRPSVRDLQGYPDLRTQPVMVNWPPARTASCWCGSGRKYKQCCRPHSLGTIDGTID